MVLLPRPLLAFAAARVLALTLSPTPSRAQDWRRAESANFVVYSNGGERPLRDFVAKLEIFDQVLRARFGVPADRETRRKLPIYFVDGQQTVRRVAPHMPTGVSGFYSAGDEDVFAVASRGDDGRTLYHEYAHHFFFQHFTARYPGWLVEGIAEYVETVDVDRGRVTLGGVSGGAAAALTRGEWIALDTLLSTRFSDLQRESDRRAYYPVAWLLTHWLLSSPERTAQLEAYLTDVSRTGDPVGAMQRATDMTLDELRRELSRYQRSSLQAAVFDVDAREIPMTVTTLPAAADDLLLIGQRLKMAQPTEHRADALAEARRLAAPWRDDPLGLLVLGHAELHFGDADEGERLLLRLLEREPDNVAALQFLAMRRLDQANDAAPDARIPLIAEARGWLARAYALDDDDFVTVSLILRMRRGAPGYPTDNDLALWEEAFLLAPQLGGLRLGAAEAFLAAGQPDVALALASPLANSPHGGGTAQAAVALVERARAALP